MEYFQIILFTDLELRFESLIVLFILEKSYTTWDLTAWKVVIMIFFNLRWCQ